MSCGISLHHSLLGCCSAVVRAQGQLRSAGVWLRNGSTRTHHGELHSTLLSRDRRPPWTGVRADEHALHETIEINASFTPWFEVGFYIFMSYRAGEGYQWVGDHIRRVSGYPKPGTGP